MATDVIMPKVDMDQETGTVGQWLKEDGDEVKQGEIILEIETDKVAIEVESPATGILNGILVEEGETVPDPFFDGQGPPRTGCRRCASSSC